MTIPRHAALCATLLLAPLAASAQGLPPGYNCLSAPQGSTISGPFYASNCDPLSAGGSAGETQGYAGLTWMFGQDTGAPLFTVGVRSIRDAGGGKVRGTDISADWNPAEGFALETVKIGYLTGKPAAIVAVGGGYGVRRDEALLTGSVEGGPLRVGAEYGIGSQEVRPFVSLTSLSRPESGSEGCGAGYARVVSDNQGVNGPILQFYNPPAFDLTDGLCLKAGPLFAQ